jgi:hypothetical protein
MTPFTFRARGMGEAMGVIAQRIKDEEATKLRTIAQDQGIIENLADIAELNADVEAKALASVDRLHDLFGVMREELLPPCPCCKSRSGVSHDYFCAPCGKYFRSGSAA